MHYLSDEVEADYKHASQLLKTAVSIFEDELAARGLELMLVDSEAKGAAWIAAVSCCEGEPEIISYAQLSANRMLARVDDEETIVYENEEVGLLSIRVTRAVDLARLQ